MRRTTRFCILLALTFAPLLAQSHVQAPSSQVVSGFDVNRLSRNQPL
jgi:hypothetical protein